MTIAENAYALLQNDFTLPVDVTSIAMKLGIKVIPYDLNEISGILVIENEKATIGFNRSESRVRNRYSIAHEIGHYILHKDKEHLFVDKNFKVMFRDNKSNKYEREANEFAACLLMPKDQLIIEMKKLDLDFTDETNIKILASIFDVSSMAMSFRISNLGLL